jgi:hypothetical protein
MALIQDGGGAKKPRRTSKSKPKVSTKATKAKSRPTRSEPNAPTRRAAEPKPKPSPAGPAVKALSKKRSNSRVRDREASSGITALQAETSSALTGSPSSNKAGQARRFWEAGESDEARAPEILAFRSDEGATPASVEETGPDHLTTDLTAGSRDSEVEVVDGVQYTTTSRELPNGSEIQTTTYEIDGVNYTQTTSENDGVSEEVLRADRDGVVETTRTRVSQVDEDLETLVEGFDDHRVIPGDRGPTEVVEVSVTVIDNNAEDPEEVVVSDSTIYQQRVPIEEPSEQLRLQGIEPLDGPNGREQADTFYYNNTDFTHDPDESAQIITFTQSNVPGPDGEPQIRTEQTSEYRLVGTGGDGQEASYSHALTWQSIDGERIGGQAVVEERGVDTVQDYRDNPGVFDDPEFLDRLGEPNEYVNRRQVNTLPPVPGVGPGERSTEFGDYDLEGDGQTLIYRDNTYADGPPPSLTYREVTNDGRTVDSQTVYYGTEISVLSHTENNPDGTFVSNTTTTDAGEVVGSQTTERTLVSPEDLSEDLVPELREEFLADYEGGPIFEDSSVIDNGESTTELTTYTADSADAAVTHLTDSEGTDVTLLDNPVDGVAVMMTPDGDRIRVEGAQVTGSINGQEITDLVDEDGQRVLDNPALGGLREVRSQASAFNRLNKVLGIVDGELRVRTTGSRTLPIPRRFGQGLNAAGVAFGAIGLADSIRNGDAVGAARSVAGATTSFSSFLGDVGLAGPRPPGASGTFTSLAQNRILRGGAYLSAGLAVYDLTQGNYEGAAIGGLNALGLALIATPEPWTSVAGLVIVSGTTLYSLKDVLTSDGLGDHVDFEF